LIVGGVIVRVTEHPKKGVSAAFRDTTARTDYVGTALRIRFRMRTRL